VDQMHHLWDIRL